MIVDDFGMKVPTKTIKSAFGNMTTPTGPEAFTGRIFCVWLINGEERGSHFDQDRLVLI